MGKKGIFDLEDINETLLEKIVFFDISYPGLGNPGCVIFITQGGDEYIMSQSETDWTVDEMVKLFPDIYKAYRNQEKGVKDKMAFIIIGDIHGTIDIEKVVRFFEEHDEFTEDDYLVICGGVGVCGFSTEREMETRKILQNLPVITLFVDGNHEHFEHLNTYPIEA